MICETVRKHQESNEGQIDMKWFEKHVETCKECQVIMKATAIMMKDNLNIKE